jgi:hypothetical protein
VAWARQPGPETTIKIQFDDRADAASVEVLVPCGPDEYDSDRLDADGFVRYGADSHPVEYEFLNVRHYGVRLDDLEHRADLAIHFADAGFHERDWGHPIPTRMVRRRDPAVS